MTVMLKEQIAAHMEVPIRCVVNGTRVVYQTKDEKPVVGVWVELPRLLGGL